MTTETGGAAEANPSKFAEELEALRERTLLDHFAGLSMQAHRIANVDLVSDLVAAWAYQDAEAMLTERAKRAGGGA